MKRIPIFFKVKNKKNNSVTAKSEKKEDFKSFLKTLILALICAGFVRSFFYEPFHIPSSSMKPNLLIGDYIFVSKYSYGYSKYSFPFSFNLFEGRIGKKDRPKRGDVFVFRLPLNPSINYIKRVIGLPGDEVQVINGQIFINSEKIEKNYYGNFVENDTEIAEFEETLTDGKKIIVLDQFSNVLQDNTGIYKVPEGSYFAMGDNRDNSEDSRFLTKVGFIPEENLVGKATIIFFSIDGDAWKIWKWPKNLRINRIFKKIE